MLKIRKNISLLLLCLFVCLPCFYGCAEEEWTEPEFKNLKWAVEAPLPSADDFVVSLPEGAVVRFAQEYEFLYLDTYRLELIVRMPSGKAKTYTVNLELCVDETPPVLLGIKDLSSSVGGEGISYLSGVTALDNCDGKVTLDVDTSAVRTNEPGVYPVVYTATDAAGNSATISASLTVFEYEITEEMLYELLDEQLSKIVIDGMTTKQKLRAVYDFVYHSISYTSTSDKSNWVRAAYIGLTEGEGDCYTYFALSKAFFERLGIENKDVQRSPEAVSRVGERHFWSLVNVGSKEEPLWYHFDTTHLIDRPVPWGFLMTDEQLAEYNATRVSANGERDYFYVFDRNGLPRTPSVPMTDVD